MTLLLRAVLILAPAAQAAVVPTLPKAEVQPVAAAETPAVAATAPAALCPAAAPLASIVPTDGGRPVEVSADPSKAEAALGTLFENSAPGGDALADPVASLTKAFLEQPRPELAGTIARASVESPREYRAALRDIVDILLPGVPRLQRHLTVLDEDGDGKVSMRESYRTLRAMSFGRLKAAIIAGASQVALVVSTGRVGLFSFAVNAGPKGLHRTVDSGAMDPQQDIAKKIDEFMAEDLDHDGWIDMKDVGRLIDRRARMSGKNRLATALVKAANMGEFAALFGLRGGRMNREDLRDFYAGSLFFGLLNADALAQRVVGLRARPKS